jgi:hypothetical protein
VDYITGFHIQKHIQKVTALYFKMYRGFKKQDSQDFPFKRILSQDITIYVSIYATLDTTLHYTTQHTTSHFHCVYSSTLFLYWFHISEYEKLDNTKFLDTQTATQFYITHYSIFGIIIITGENFIMRSLMICTPHPKLCG